MADTQVDTKVKIPGYLELSKIIVWFLYFWIMIGIVSLVLRVFLLAFSASVIGPAFVPASRPSLANLAD